MDETTFFALNRAALVVRHKKPYVDWANALDEDGPKLDPDYPEAEHTIYLVEELTFDLDPEPALIKHHSSIFAHELANWHRDTRDWPAVRDLKAFKEWFDVEMHSLVLDLAEEDFEIEELAA